MSSKTDYFFRLFNTFECRKKFLYFYKYWLIFILFLNIVNKLMKYFIYFWAKHMP